MNNRKIGLFFGGKMSQHLGMIKRAGNQEGVDLELISYNRVVFDTNERRVKIRLGRPDEVKRFKEISDFDVLFFRTTGKHWEEVDLIVGEARKDAVIVDPLIKYGKQSWALKAKQMVELAKNGIDTPRSLYGSVQFLKFEAGKKFGFPLIIKGSGGDRGTRVYKCDNQEELEKLCGEIRGGEIEEGKRYMAQEYIENDGDFRVLVLGDKVLGAMKRIRGDLKGEFKNNFSQGGRVEPVKLPKNIYDLAIKAAKVCKIAVAGVDVALRDGDINKPVIWEVNKGPQFKGFMMATGVDVPREIVRFLKEVKD